PLRRSFLTGASRSGAFPAGSEGVPVPFRPGLWTLGFASKVTWVYIMLALALGIFAVQIYLEHSRLGYRLAGVREDEDAAQALGIPSRPPQGLAIPLSAPPPRALGTPWGPDRGFAGPFYA